MNCCFLFFFFFFSKVRHLCKITKKQFKACIHFEAATVSGLHNYFRSARIAIVFGRVISTSIFTVLLSTVSKLAFHNLVKVSFVKTEAK